VSVHHSSKHPDSFCSESVRFTRPRGYKRAVSRVWDYRVTLVVLCTLAFFATMVARLVISPVVPGIVDTFDALAESGETVAEELQHPAVC
jgi:hypothetical protein